MLDSLIPPDLGKNLAEAVSALSGAELLGTVTGLACVALTVRAHILCWPIGIVSCAAFAKLFFDIKLYADAILQLFFIATSVWGWWGWLHAPREGAKGTSEPPPKVLPISRLSGRETAVQLGVTVSAILLTGWMFRSYTDAHLPFWDSTIAGLSVTAQILLVRKKLENWVLWIIVDVLSIGVYFYKKVYLTSALYAVFLVLASRGLYEWSREWKKERRTEWHPNQVPGA
jgi:nicotinamide mononucleotide transporter